MGNEQFKDTAETYDEGQKLKIDSYKAHAMGGFGALTNTDSVIVFREFGKRALKLRQVAGRDLGGCYKALSPLYGQTALQDHIALRVTGHGGGDRALRGVGPLQQRDNGHHSLPDHQEARFLAAASLFPASSLVGSLFGSL